MMTLTMSMYTVIIISIQIQTYSFFVCMPLITTKYIPFFILNINSFLFRFVSFAIASGFEPQSCVKHSNDCKASVSNVVGHPLSNRRTKNCLCH